MFDIGNPEVIFLLFLSLLSLMCCSTLFKKDKFLETMIGSFFLVIFDLPHLFLLKMIVNGNTSRLVGSSLFLSLVLFFGIGCFVVGVFGIVYSAIAMARKTVT